MGYPRPVDAVISDSWQVHRNRRPPSTEPGTDYACGYGTPVIAPADGAVVAVKTTNTGAMGRVVMVRMGRDYARGLHLSRVDVAAGDRFTRGHQLGLSGGSAKGDDRGVGSHLHWSFWFDWGDAVPSPGRSMTNDFETFVGPGGFAAIGEGDMPLNDADVAKIEGVVARQLKNWTGYPDRRNYGRTQQIDQTTSDIMNRILPPGAPWDQLQLSVSLLGQILVAIGRDNVDEAQLAAALAPLVAENVSALSDDDVAALANASLDEANRRGRGRGRPDE